jgi:hypothetical protein
VVAFADISTEILGLTIEMLCCPLVVEEHRAVYAFVVDDHALQQVHSHRIVGAYELTEKFGADPNERGRSGRTHRECVSGWGIVDEGRDRAAVGAAVPRPTGFDVAARGPLAHDQFAVDQDKEIARGIAFAEQHARVIIH